MTRSRPPITQRRLRLSTFVFFALLSATYMVVYLDRWEISWVLFVLGITGACTAALTAEVLVTLMLRRTHPIDLTRRRWLASYAISSISGSIVLLFTMVLIGLEQQRAPYVVVVIIATRLVDTWIFGFAFDEIASYRATADTARRHLLPTLAVTRSVNDHLAEASAASESRDLELIRSRIWIPLKRIHERVHLSQDAQSAERIEAFIDSTLRPMSHDLHPVTAGNGLMPAIQSLGFGLEAAPVIAELDSTGDLLDEDVRQEIFRWTSQVIPVPEQPTSLRLELRERSLVITLFGGNGPRLDPLQMAAGLATPAAQMLTAPLKGQYAQQLLAQSVQPSGQPPRTHFLLRGWQWQGQGAHLSVPLVAAIAIAAAPGSTVIANQTVTSANVAAAITWLVVPVVIAFLLAQIRVSGQGHRPLAWFVGAWLGLGLLTGLTSGATYLFLDPAAEPSIVVMEILRAIVRLTLLGGAVAFTAELAGNANRALTDIEDALETALKRRADILDEARERSKLISEVLHRRIQGRLAAIAVLFRMHDRARAAAELATITTHTLPELMSTLVRGVTKSRRVDELEVPPGLNVDVHGAHECDFVPLETEAAVCTLIEEAATNAHRHGHATHLAVEIRRSEDRLLMSCADNGDGPGHDMNPGLGSRLFDEAVKPNGSWSIEPTEIGTTVTFTVPIAESSTASHEQQRVHQAS